MKNTCINKYHLNNKELSYINDYGIYNYFNSNPNSKMIARIADNNYVINVCDKDLEIKPNINKKEKEDCDIISLGNELNIFCGNNLTNNQINSLIEVLKETEKYYQDTNINKQIFFIGGSYDKKFNMYNNCKDINKIINELEKEKTPIINTNNTINSMGFAKLWILGILTIIISIIIIIIGVSINF